ncbi:MAG: type II secretion system protein GspG [Myxococcota bacterium]|nr:type II secretion system protein GspG [Myxococcota bacterium]
MSAHLTRAFTLIEIAMVLAILGVLSSSATAGYLRYQDRARQTQVIVDLSTISKELDGYEVTSGGLPPDLATLGADIAAMTDPWGNPYEYTVVATSPIGKLRKDKFLVPINSDYDLYSKGPDGKSVSPLTAKPSRDDIIRGSNGSYFGRADGY